MTRRLESEAGDGLNGIQRVVLVRESSMLAKLKALMQEQLLGNVSQTEPSYPGQ